MPIATIDAGSEPRTNMAPATPAGSAVAATESDDRVRAAAPRYRGDIDGLRAISILAVIAFHAGVTGFEGGYVGVDVFFVISGYLITGLLIREVSETGTISLGKFYSRRIRRLLPLSATVLATTLVLGTALSLPLTRDRLVADALSASMYMSNWRYSIGATAYSDVSVEDGLLVHFWSLSIEEQFYFLWPFLIIGVAIAHRKFPRLPLRASIGAVLFAVTATSFLFSRSLTASRGEAAYYLTHARLWEMGVGAGLALVAPRLPVIGRRLSAAMAASGLLAIGVAILAFDSTTPFPGTAALLPVLGCAAIITSGLHSTGTISRLLGASPMRFIGRLSYAWYLWHWPVIGIALLWNQRAEADVPRSLVVLLAVVVSFLLSWATHLTIENPMRQLSSLRGHVRRNLTLGLVLTAIPLFLGIGLLATVETGDTRVATAAGIEDPDPMTSRQAALDLSPIANKCDEDPGEPTSPEFCQIGNPDGAYRVVLIGDSHAKQWIPSFQLIAEAEDWSVQVSTRSSCTLIDVDIWSVALGQPDINCDEWRPQIQQFVEDMDSIDLIVMGRSAFYKYRVLDEQGDFLGEGPELHEAWADGAARTFANYADLADRVVFLADTPWPGESPPECLSGNPSTPEECAFDRAESIDDQEFLDTVRPIATAEGIEILDTASLVCSTPTCPVVTPNGHVLYRDSHHLTATFARDLTPDFFAALTANAG